MGLKSNMVQKEHHQSSEILSSIFELNPDAIALTRASDGEFIDCNQEFLNQIGYNREEVIGRTSLELNLYNQEERERYVNEIRRKEDLHNFELRLKRKDGTLFDILFSARFIIVDDEEIILNIGKDITDRKKVETEIQNLCEELDVANEELRAINEELFNANEILKENAELYQQFFNTPLNGFALCEIITDDGGKPCDFVYIEVNQTFEDFTGLKREDVLNKKVTEILPPDEASELIEIYSPVALLGEKVHFEKPRPSLNRYYEIYAFSPEKKQFIALITDITSHKLAEERALKAQKDWEDTFEAVPDLIAIVDIDYQILRVNQALAGRLGVKADNCIGRKCFELIHGSNEPPLICPHKLMLEDGKEHKIEVNEAKLKGDFINSASPIHNKKQEIAGCVHVLRDITERKKAEKTLQVEHDLLQDIMNGAKNSHLVYLDRNFNFVRVNEAYAQTCGYRPEEMIGKNHFDLYPHEENEAIFSHVRDTGEMVEYHDKPFEFPDQPERGVTYWDWTLTPIKSQNDVVSLIFSLYETTKSKRAELKIKKLLENEQQLTEELQVSNEELIDTQNKLRKSINKLEISNQELEQFAYVASHDLQEPLRMVGSFTQLLEKRYKNKLDDDADEYIGFIVEGSHRMKDLIDDLLVFSRLNTDKKEFKLTDLNQLLENVLFNFKSVIEDNKIQIIVDSLPIIKCDESQVNQLFQNLISNAIKFRDEKTPEIHISCQNSDNHWLFGVSDNGIGIDAEHQDKIFDVFRRLHNRDEYEGTGIGLAICKRIVERHEGQIWVESEQGQGSTFYFTLPQREMDIYGQKFCNQ